LLLNFGSKSLTFKRLVLSSKASPWNLVIQLIRDADKWENG
jgi:hypothetical protein